jgi:yecA family protein
VALALKQQETAAGAAEIIAALSQAQTLPRAILPRAIECAGEIAPAVIETIDAAARGVFLLPDQDTLLFWGLHAMAAARRPELHRPLMALLRQAPFAELDCMLGDAIAETLKQIIISTFDGDPEPLVAACADRSLDGALRWNLLLALARLTFDGRIARETTHALLQRFERESLADPENLAWHGWQDAVTLLGFEDLRDRLHAVWNDGRLVQKPTEQAHFERQLGIAQALAAGDDALFEAKGAVALTDPVAALHWTDHGDTSEEEEEDRNDPAAVVALKPFEINWLSNFLISPKVPKGTMPLETVDGFFSAMIAGPGGTSLEEQLPFVWDRKAAQVPRYDSAEQEQYVRGLLARHWTAIGMRLAADYRHRPILTETAGPDEGRSWAAGFLFAVVRRKAERTLRITEEAVTVIYMLMTRLAFSGTRRDAPLDPETRREMVAALPAALAALYQAWRGRFQLPSAVPDPGRKVGRNEPCPCGSGKKYKRCCGAPERRD